MISFKNRLIIFLLVSFGVPYLGSAQNMNNGEVDYEINRVLPYISITKENLKDVHVLSDIDPQFKPSWVRKYLGVEMLAYQEGIKMKGLSKNDTISFQQMRLLEMADIGSEVLVIIKYIPENSLKNNDPKEIKFTFSFGPESDASFVGGEQALNQFLKEKAIDKLPADNFEKYNIAAIKFTVTEEGEIINAHVFKSAYQTYNNEKVYGVLLETIRSMPCWKPAEYANGTKVKQDFVLTAGDMTSCTVNLLNIRKLAVEE